MEITIKVTSKEIADLVMELQDRQKAKEPIEAIIRAFSDVLQSTDDNFES
ncbi:MAG: hypothetical protein IJ428_01195 [Clostridia bacterium]|nr:hypothetical protein [Clostridia bacterium]